MTIRFEPLTDFCIAPLGLRRFVKHGDRGLLGAVGARNNRRSSYQQQEPFVTGFQFLALCESSTFPLSYPAIHFLFEAETWTPVGTRDPVRETYPLLLGASLQFHHLQLPWFYSRHPGTDLDHWSVLHPVTDQTPDAGWADTETFWAIEIPACHHF